MHKRYRMKFLTTIVLLAVLVGILALETTENNSATLPQQSFGMVENGKKCDIIINSLLHILIKSMTANGETGATHQGRLRRSPQIPEELLKRFGGNMTAVIEKIKEHIQKSMG